MCHYADVLGSGDALVLQLITASAIAASIAAWVLAYRAGRVPLGQYALPIAVWIVFGTLDIMITAAGTFGNPLREGNPLARWVFLWAGWIGPALASALWISLWSGLVLAANRALKADAARFVSLTVFYSLGIGHVLGFSSWFMPLCALSRFSWELLPDYPARFFGIAAAGCAAGALHMLASGRISSGRKG